MRVRTVLVYLACCVTWGSTWAVIAIGLRDLPPLLFAGTRMVLAGALLAPFAWREASRVPRRELSRLAGLGVLQIALPYALMFVAQQWTPSALAAMLFASFPVWLALLGRLVLREPLGPARLVAVALGVGGVAVLQAPAVARVAVSGPLVLASLLIVAASISAAVANVMLKRMGTRFSPTVMTAVQTACAGTVLLAAAVLAEHGRPAAFTPRALAAIGYLAVFATVGTYLGLYWLLPRVPLAVVATIPLLDTTVAVLLGALVLGEGFGWHHALGGGLVVGAAALANLAQPAARTGDVRPPPTWRVSRTVGSRSRVG